MDAKILELKNLIAQSQIDSALVALNDQELDCVDRSLAGIRVAQGRLMLKRNDHLRYERHELAREVDSEVMRLEKIMFDLHQTDR